MFRFEVFTGFELLLCTQKCSPGDIVTAVKSCEFLLSALSVKLNDVGIRPAVTFLLADKIVLIRHGGDLRQMCHAHNLFS